MSNRPSSPSRVTGNPVPTTNHGPRSTRVDIAAVRLAMRRTGGRLKLAAVPRIRGRA